MTGLLSARHHDPDAIGDLRHRYGILEDRLVGNPPRIDARSQLVAGYLGSIPQVVLPASAGVMAQECGACHSSLGGPTFEGESPEGTESSVAADMQRHRWAADRMWEGLVGPWDTAWQAGVVALADARLTPGAMADDRTLPKEVFELAEQAHEIGAKGGDEKDPANSTGATSARVWYATPSSA